MTTDKFQYRGRRALAVALVLSLLGHFAAFVVMLALGNLSLTDDEELAKDDNQEFEVQTIDAEELEALVAEEKPLTVPPPLDKVPEPPREPPPPPDERKAVVQETNQERPTEAKFVSEDDNKVAEETRARETTLEDLDPGKRAEPEKPEEPVEVARREEERPRQSSPKPSETNPEPAVKPPEEVEAGENPLVFREPAKPVDPQRLLMPNLADYEEVFGAADGRARKHVEALEGVRKPRLFANHERKTEALRASIENFIPEVRPGNHTGVNAHRSTYSGYIAKIHRRIHPRWANGYLMYLDTQVGRGSPLANPNLNTTLEFVIRANDGVVEKVNIVKSSGEFSFDTEAVSIALAVGPQPDPPPDIVSPNGRVYIHWEFWRNQRQCGTFGASVFVVETDEG